MYIARFISTGGGGCLKVFLVAVSVYIFEGVPNWFAGRAGEGGGGGKLTICGFYKQKRQNLQKEGRIEFETNHVSKKVLYQIPKKKLKTLMTFLLMLVQIFQTL